MADNVTHLPRPRAVRTAPEPLGLYVRAGRNDHKEILNLSSAGDFRCFGIVIDAVYADRHKELREHIAEHRLDAILDPKTQASATVGGYTEAIRELPWGLEQPHRVNDFAGRAGRERACSGVGIVTAARAVCRTCWRTRLATFCIGAWKMWQIWEGRRSPYALIPSSNPICVRRPTMPWQLPTSTGRMTGWRRRPEISANGWMPCGLRSAITGTPIRRTPLPRCPCDAPSATVAVKADSGTEKISRENG